MHQVTSSAVSPAVFLPRQAASWMAAVAWLLQSVVSVVDCVQTAASPRLLLHLYVNDAEQAAVVAQLCFAPISCAWTVSAVRHVPLLHWLSLLQHMVKLGSMPED